MVEYELQYILMGREVKWLPAPTVPEKKMLMEVRVGVRGKG
jgi:hypothetical protein